MKYLIDKAGYSSDAVLVPSPNWDERPEGVIIDTLVIHAISLPPDQFGGSFICDLFTNTLDPAGHPYFKEINHLRVSSHYLINRAGEVTQFVSALSRAWHAGVSEFSGRCQVNDFSVGIELEGCDTQPFELAQYQELSKLTYSIQSSFSGITKERIVGHSDIAPGRKTDPGPCFDWELYRNLLEQVAREGLRGEPDS
ncbi:MAG: 1,6-anhydro-N-acetylmuramyl-L-alanine amidase AmpD [Acidiferrobacterales bacterium]|nr:1,6-anhydro-N-acetylmuramyl-L-alanine amidase AmpD [Acidiferrobacterales bacterium]